MSDIPVVPSDCSHFSHPYAFVDKKNESIIIKGLNESNKENLNIMYLEKVPRNCFNGLPPLDDGMCKKWVQQLIDGGINIIAFSFQEGVVGHACVLPMEEGMCEMVIVVYPKYQGRGIGTQLTRYIVQIAYEDQYDKIWLSVEAGNHVARHVYLKCGFKYLSTSHIDELDMILDLRGYRHKADQSVMEIINKDVIAANIDMFCIDAIKLFAYNNISSLPVVNKQNELVGLLSETDLIMEINFQQHISDIMTRGVVSIRDNTTIAKVIRLFQSKKYRCFPVVDSQNHLAGVIGRRDILKYYLDII
ncbi:MAG: GNAT family N-acetyltransferase [Fibrobacteria bacterium]|nr:GNAT family N-acetyltransferase [Fibrobacteria bacterium]